MKQERRGIIFADDNQTFSQINKMLEFNNLERLLKKGVDVSRDVICCISELDRKDQLKIRSKNALATLNRITEIERNTAKIQYDNLIEGMQIELEAHAELLELELERCRLEVEEKIKQENFEFEMYKQKSDILSKIFKDEIKQLEFMQKIIDEYLLDIDTIYKNRKEFQLFFDSKKEILNNISIIKFV